MVKTIETRAVISAQDRTGQTFAQIAQKVRNMENAATQASRRIQTTAQSTHAAIEKSSRIANTIAPVAAATAPAIKTMKTMANQAARQRHELVRMENSGMSASEIAHATAEAQRLSREFKPIGQTDIMHMLRNARSGVGSYEEAAHIAEPLLKLRVISQHAAGARASVEQINEEFDKLVKSAEIMGRTQDLRKFTGYMQGVAKAINVFGDTIKPHEYFEAAQMSNGAASYWSPDFVAGVMPTMIQHMGGAKAGTALGSLYSAVIGGKMTLAAARDLNKLGLIDPNKIVKNKIGDVKGIKPGAIKDSGTFMADPYRWVTTTYADALKKAGVTNSNDIAARVAVDFSNSKARQAVTQWLTQQPLFEKDRSLTHGAKGLEAANDIMTKDYDQAVKGLKNQVESLAAAAGKPFMDPLIGSINKLGEAAAAAGDRLNKDPNAATHAAIGAGLAAGAAGYVGASGIGGLFTGGLAGAGGAAAGAALGVVPIAVVGAAGLGLSYATVDMIKRGGGPMTPYKPRDSREMANVIADEQAKLMRARRRGDHARAAEAERALSSNPWVGPQAADGKFGQSRQQVDVKVSADAVPIEGKFTVTASSELIRIVEAAKQVSTKANLKSSIGSNGSTDMGNQQR